LDEMIKLFDIKNVTTAPAMVTDQKLVYFNHVHMQRRLSSPAGIESTIRQLQDEWPKEIDAVSSSELKKAIKLVRPNVTSLKSLSQLVQPIVIPPQLDSNGCVRFLDEKLLYQASRQFMSSSHFLQPALSYRDPPYDRMPIYRAFCEIIDHVLGVLEPVDESNWTMTVTDPIVFMEVMRTLDIKVGMISSLLRLALVGGSAGPSTAETMAFLGRSETLKRVEALQNHLVALSESAELKAIAS